ncbi:MAG: CBS domain-containing protein [Microthrixaceae bacterium]
MLKKGVDKTVKDIMTSDVVTVEEPITAEEALNIAYENKVERLPVTS